MNTISEFQMILTHHRDQWEAHCRDWIAKQSDEDMLVLTKYLFNKTKHGDDMESLAGYLALLGLVSAWVHVDDSPGRPPGLDEALNSGDGAYRP